MEQVTLTVSQEFFNPRALIEKLPDFTSKIRQFLTDRNVIGVQGFDTLTYKPLEDKISTVPYANMRDLKAFVPHGLGVTYLDYIDTLEDSVRISASLQVDILVPFRRWLSLKLADPSTLANLRSGREIQDFKPHALQPQINRVSKCFGSNNRGQTTYGKVVRRHTDLKDATAKLNDLNVSFMAIKRREVMGQIEEIVNALDKLYQRTQEDATEYEISEHSLSTLAALCQTMAEEVEFFSATGYQLQALTTAIKDTTVELEGWLKAKR